MACFMFLFFTAVLRFRPLEKNDNCIRRDTTDALLYMPNAKLLLYTYYYVDRAL
jgi:hypothetical protein